MNRYSLVVVVILNFKEMYTAVHANPISVPYKFYHIIYEYRDVQSGAKFQQK